MIQMLTDGGAFRYRMVPVFVCDVCKQRITQITDALAVFQNWVHTEGDLQDILHVHKSRCLARAEVSLGLPPGTLLTCELGVHFAALVGGTGVTLSELVEDLTWSKGISMELGPEMQNQLDQLDKLLREIGVVSCPPD